MWYSAFILTCLLSAADETWFYGEVPSTAATFKITFASQEADFYGGILVEENWLQDEASLSAEVKRVEIVFDTPWAPQPHLKEFRSKIQLDYEAPVLRKKRLEQGWDAADFEFLETAEGRRPYKRQEIEYARRAREMAAAVEQLSQPPQTLAQTPDSEDLAPAAPAAPPPGFLRQWGAHLLLGVLAVGMLTLIVKTLILSDDT